jgi:glucose/arabinose dehydrogenase
MPCKKFWFTVIFCIPLFISAPSAFSANLPDGFHETVVVSNLDSPVGLEFLPDGRLLVIEQGGKVRLVVNGALRKAPLLDISDQIISSGEQGLLGIAADPGFPIRPYIYLYYTNKKPNRQYVVRYTMKGKLGSAFSNDLKMDKSSVLFLLDDIPNRATNHNGGTLRFGPDKTLFISIGDDAEACTAQDRTSLQGVILRISVDSMQIDPATKMVDRISMVPKGNPWASSGNENEKLVWAYGLRNPYRFTIDGATGRLVIGDVGSKKREELNLSKGGENFEWPYMEGSVKGYSTDCGGAGEAGVMGPIHEVKHKWPSSIIPGPLYRGSTYPGNLSFPPIYEGVIFFTDYYRGYLRALRYSSGSWSPFFPKDRSGINFGSGLANPSDLIAGPNGAIYYTAHQKGQVRKIGYSKPK